MNIDTLGKLLESKKVYSFGTSGLYKKYAQFLSQYDIEGYLDNNPAMIGKTIEGKEVYNPSDFNYSDESYIVIMSSFSDEISDQLKGYGLEHFKDFCTAFDIEHIFRLNIMFEPGHYYSPIPDTIKIFSPEYKGYERSRAYKGIDLNYEKQVELLHIFSENKSQFEDLLNQQDLNFYLNNGFYEYTDAWTYFSFILNFNPKKIIEIGSGFTSALALDTVKYLNREIEFTFIEPYPDRLLKLLPEFTENSKLVQDFVQNVSVDVLTDLNENDILFIDSSHVSKMDSDVNYLFFEVLPSLKKGTIIHLHDIFDEFEYPKDWIYKSRFWNENYLLRAFLQYNDEFEILYFSNYLFKNYPDLESLLGDHKDVGGSIWLIKKV